MPRYADVLCGRLVLRNAAVTTAAGLGALTDIKAALAMGGELARAEPLERRRAVPADVLERIRQALARAQHLEAEKAFARLVVEAGLAQPDVVRALVEEC